MNNQEREIWRDVCLLHHIYPTEELAYDAHEIFRMAFRASRIVSWHNNHPLAFRLTMALVDYYVDLWKCRHHETISQDVGFGRGIWADSQNYS